MTDRLQLIFETQEGLMEKYHDIEALNGFHNFKPETFDINEPYHQHHIKSKAWCFIEETGEAMNEIKNFMVADDNYMAKVKEEMIDGLHFLTELTITVGMNYDQISDFELQPGEADYLHQLHNDGVEILETLTCRGAVVESSTGWSIYDV